MNGEDLPMTVKKRETLPDLQRRTFYPVIRDYITDSTEGALSQGNTAVISLADVANLQANQSLTNGYISVEELDALEGRTFFDRPIVAHGLAFLMAIVTVTILCWALFEL